MLSPVHRVSVSVSPYLFGHAPKPGTPESATNRRVILTEEPEDNDAAYEEMEREPYEAPAAVEESAPAPTASAVVENSAPEPSKTEAEPPQKLNIIETDDEVLEP